MSQRTASSCPSHARYNSAVMLERGPQAWALKAIAAHLRDAEELALAQLNAFASGGSKPLPAWDVDVLPQERDYQGEEIDRLLAGFRALRRETTYLLWGLTDGDWRGRGHPPPPAG